jgi:hypothetical protein
MGSGEFKSKKLEPQLTPAITVGYTDIRDPQPDSSDFA